MERTTIEGIDLNDPERFVRLEHHEMFTRLRAEDPVYWQPDDLKGGGYWNVVKHADLIEVNRDTATFSSEKGGTMIMSGQFPIGEDPDMPFDTRGVLMLDMDPPKHTRYRLLVNKGFTPRMIGLIEQALRHRATVIVDNVIEAGSADFVNDIAAELPLQAIAEIMGVPQEDRRKLFDWTNRMIGAGDPEFMDNDQQTAFVELFAYANELAGLRRDDPRDDIVTKLLNAEIEGEQLSETRVRHVLAAARGGRQRDHPQRDRARHVRAHDQPGAVRDVEAGSRGPHRRRGRGDPALGVAGAALPAYRDRRHRDPGPAITVGDRVVIWHISANRDEEVWDDPFVFDITRTPNQHVAFGGGGSHFCLGANLARMELKLILTELVTRMPDMQLAGEPQ